MDRDLGGEGRRGGRWPTSIVSPEIALVIAGVGALLRLPEFTETEGISHFAAEVRSCACSASR
ncbi:hypothetical protein, partial [Streptomyces sp. SID2119]|uniref:hypothetical protein n=1 Tax=Streptomyces sp. SID2119 TaxID=2690253 RepID=UPI001F1FE3E6